MYRSRLRFAHSRAAFTLIELLVSMTITLIMIYALVQVMVYISTYVSEGRGQIEMAGSVRGVRAQLKKDLLMATVFLRPAPGNDNAPGGFEVYEGPRSDADIDGNTIFDVNEASYTDAAGAPQQMNRNKNKNKSGAVFLDSDEGRGPRMGDGDDAFWLTARATELEPFVGTVNGARLTSDLAEIAWFVCHWEVNSSTTSNWVPTFPVGRDPTPMAPPTQAGNSSGDVAEFRQECTLYRRTLLIRPDANTQDDGSGIFHIARFPPAPSATYWTALPDPSQMANLATIPATGTAVYYTGLFQFWQNNDLSVRIERRIVGGTPYYYLIANSLSDLSRRENRFATMWNPQVFIDPQANFGAGRMFAQSQADLTDRTIHRDKMGWIVLQNNRLGQDIMLSHVTGFDLRVYDSEAVTVTDVPNNPTGMTPTIPSTILTPGDPGYNAAYASYGTASPSNIAGKGAFVDLGYGIYTPSASSILATYGPVAKAGGLATVYDSWSYSYEHDGINQADWCPDPTSMSMPPANLTLIDEGTDGLDNDSKNGVDDPGERETLPPYISVLQGLQIRIRIYDQSIRLGRQATVVTEFNR